MKYIRSCESCKADIRFPIDKGTLFVTCPYCKYTFRIDPDDPSLYAEGRFDVLKKNVNFPEEFFYHQERSDPSYSPSYSSKDILKKIIVLLLFTLLFSHLFKIYNAEPIPKEDFHDAPNIQTEEKGKSEYDI